MKKLLIFLIIVCVAMSMFAKVNDKIIAKAGKEIILSSDLLKQINQMKSAKVLNDNYKVEDILNDMIDNKIIIQKAKELNLAVDDIRIKSTIDKQIATIKSQFPNEESFFSELRKANITLSELKKYYETMLTEQQLKDQVIQNYIRKKINISDSEVKAFYVTHKDSLFIHDTRYNTYLILRNAKVSPITKENALLKIKEIQKRLKKGESFESVAKQLSDCPSGANGGDLGYFGKGMMVKSFEDAAFALKVGETSGIVETTFGYHLIKKTDKKDDEIRASHILIKVEPSAQDIENEIKFMNDLKARISQGESFQDLAFQYSEDDSSKINHGLIGTYTNKEFPELFADNLKNLKNNEVSEVIQNEETFYLFTISQILEDNQTAYEDVKLQLKEMIMQQKQIEVYKQWIEQTRNEMYVKVYEDRLNELIKEIK